MSTLGKFIRTLIPFQDAQGHGISSDDQARQILNNATGLIKNGCAGVLITYSANFEQTVKIVKTYKDGGWDTSTNGANQAATIASMETLMGTEFTQLQDKMRIAPITTMTYILKSDIDKTGYDNQTHMEVLKEDLDRIESYLDNGWDVLGWVNQVTDPEFAVGGGVANGIDPNNKSQIKFPKDLQSYVRKTLVSFEKKYV